MCSEQSFNMLLQSTSNSHHFWAFSKPHVLGHLGHSLSNTKEACDSGLLFRDHSQRLDSLVYDLYPFSVLIAFLL